MDIHEAYEGKIEMLKACYGSGEESKDKPKVANRRSATIEEFDKITGAR